MATGASGALVRWFALLALLTSYLLDGVVGEIDEACGDEKQPVSERGGRWRRERGKERGGVN